MRTALVSLVGLFLIVVVNLSLSYRSCYRCDRTEDDGVPAGYHSGSLLLYLSRLLWCLGVLVSVHNIIFVLVDRVMGYKARAATDMWNDVLSLGFQKRYYRVPPKPPYDTEEWLAVVIRDIVLTAEMAVAGGCLLLWPPRVWSMLVVAYLGIVKIAYNLRSAVAHLREEPGVVWNRHRIVLTFLINLGYFVIAFAVVYGYLAQTPEMFAGTRAAELANHWETALYYSMVTITTLGYGDIHPEKQVVQLAVVAQLTTGLFMLAVLLQSVMALAVRGEPECGAGTEPKKRR